MTIAQMMKLVAYAAAACMCVLPAVELRDVPPFRPSDLILFEAMAIPLTWAVLSFVLVKNGPRKDLIILALVLVPLSVALGTLAWFAGSGVLRWFSGPRMTPRNLAGLGGFGFVCLWLGGCWWLLASQVVRGVVRAGRWHLSPAKEARRGPAKPLDAVDGRE